MLDQRYITKSLASPFAAQIGNGGQNYTDYDQWTYHVVRNWQAGQGYSNDSSEGFYYGEIESRFDGALMLPPKLEKRADLDGCCIILGYCGQCCILDGDKIYTWDNELSELSLKCEVPGAIGLDAVVYDGYMWIANGPSLPISWVDLATCTSGTVGDVASNQYICADGFELAYGILYAHCQNRVCYVTSPRLSCEDDLVVLPDSWGSYMVPPDEPPDLTLNNEWSWFCLDIGDCNNCETINGIATVLDGSLSQPYTYISTDCGLWALLPGDTPLYVRDWPYASPNNGVGMIEHYGSVYAPVGDTVYKFGTDGVFLDTSGNRERPIPCHKRGNFKQLQGVGNQIYGLMQPEETDRPASLWVFANSGWHMLTCLPEGEYACEFKYDKDSRQTFICTDKGLYTIAQPNVNENPLGFENSTYAPEGFADLGQFSGDLLEVDKYFHSFYIDGSCISEETPVKIWYREDDPYEPCLECSDTSSYDGWTLVGTATSNQSEVFWECGAGPAAKRIYFRLQLCSNDCTKSPVVNAYRLKYLPKVRNKYRWSFSFTIPWCDLKDICGREIPGYSQQEWLCRIENAISSNRPVKYQDIDGQEYHVWITDSSRTRSLLGISDDSIDSHDSVTSDVKFTYEFTMGVLQVCPDPPEPCVYEKDRGAEADKRQATDEEKFGTAKAQNNSGFAI